MVRPCLACALARIERFAGPLHVMGKARIYLCLTTLRHIALLEKVIAKGGAEAAPFFRAEDRDDEQTHFAR